MKVCKECGTEISTKDGINICPSCAIGVKSGAVTFANRQDKKQREEILLDMGLTKVQGSFGGIFFGNKQAW